MKKNSKYETKYILIGIIGAALCLYMIVLLNLQYATLPPKYYFIEAQNISISEINSSLEGFNVENDDVEINCYFSFNNYKEKFDVLMYAINFEDFFGGLINSPLLKSLENNKEKIYTIHEGKNGVTVNFTAKKGHSQKNQKNDRMPPNIIVFKVI